MKNIILYLLFLVICTACSLDNLHEDVVVEPTNCLIVVDFEIVMETNCKAPCEVSFINNSENATSFEWDFEDGSSSTLGNPSIVYDKPGEYDVVLKALDGTCEKSLTKRVSIGWFRFSKNLGGIQNDWGESVQQTVDGGFIICGITESEGAGNRDAYLVKTDKGGEVEWSNTFGGIGEDWGYSVQQTIDGKYIIGGTTASEGAGVKDIYVVKANESGTKEWSRTFGGEAEEWGYSVQQTSDGEYIATGCTKSEGAGLSDVYLVKIRNSGMERWSRTFGGIDNDRGITVQETSDGGFVIVGFTNSEGAGAADVYLMKTNNNGIKDWSNTFGGINIEWGNSVQETSDGGFIIAGYVVQDSGYKDIYLLKTNSLGTKEWSNVLGGAEHDVANFVQQTSDGGYIICGYTFSEGNGASDVYLVKTNSLGEQEWSNTFGGTEDESGDAVQQTSDGGYIIVGSVNNLGASGYDIYLLKTDDQGNIE